MAAIQVEWLLAGVRDTSGQPLNAGKVYTYEAGTTTNKTTYQDVDKTTPHANPIVLDSNGRKLVFAEGAYKFVVHTSADVLVYTFDDLTYRVETGGYTYVATSAGSANAQTLSPSPAPTAYTAGDVYKFIAGASNTGALTLNVSSLGAKSVKCPDGSACIGGEVANGRQIEVTYDGTNFILTSFEPEWTTWSLGTITASAGSPSLFSTAYAQFKHWGDKVEIRGHVSGGSQGTAAATYYTMVGPKAAKNLGGNQVLTASMSQGSPSAARTASAFMSNNSTTLTVYGSYDLTATGFAVGSSISFFFSGEYTC
jgi:hypothetical protein